MAILKTIGFLQAASATALLIAACGSDDDYKRSPPPPPGEMSFCQEDFVATDHFSAGSSINGQNGWANAGGLDESVENIGAAAKAGLHVWRLSNRIVNGAFGNQPLSPELSESAGESTVRSAGGGDSMEVVFWMRPVSASADGSSITISMSPPRGERLSYFRIINDLDAKGGFQTKVIDYYDVHATGLSRSYVPSTGMSRAAWTKVRLVAELADGSSNDVFKIFLNDQLVGTHSTWEDYWTWPSGGNGATLAVNRQLFRVATLASGVDPSFIDANAQGFYFDSVCYRVYNRSAPDTTIQFYRTGFEP